VTEVWTLAAVWLGLALVATLLAIVFRISTALSEIVIGTVAQVVIGAFVGTAALGAKAPWITFLSGTGAIVLTFLAGAELDPEVFRSKLKEASILGVVAFVSPFLGCTALAYYGLHWSARIVADRHRSVDHLRRSRLCGHAGVRSQCDRVREDAPGRLLH
jgi:Kef-type K+ transport system membrane component KefB